MRLMFNKIIVSFLVLCATELYAVPTCPVTTPASNATINGLAYNITGSISGAPSAHSVEVIFDGDTQPSPGSRIWLTSGQPQWSMTWNTNLRFDTPGYGWITVNVYDAANSLLCTATNTGITINNAFRYTPSQIYFSALTVTNGTGGSGCTTTTWTGKCNFSASFTGTNSGTDSKSLNTSVDGDYRNSGQGSPTSAILDSSAWPNGSHLVCMFTKDNTLHAPLGEWCKQITFSNSTTASEAIISPINWTIPANGTIQLTCKKRNADGSDGGACSSVTWGTTDITTVNQSNPASTRICSVNSSGLVSATSGVNFGLCIVTATVSGIMTPSTGPTVSIYGMVNNSPGPIPHFGTDGQIHTTCTSASDCMWLADSFNTSSTLSGFADPLIQNRLSLFGVAYTVAGFNSVEPGATGETAMATSENTFKTDVQNYIAKWTNYANYTNGAPLYFHPVLSGELSCNSAGNGYPDGLGSTADYFWAYTIGYNNNAGWTKAPMSWVAGYWLPHNAIGFSGHDEGNYQQLTYPGPVGTIGATSGPTRITTNNATPPIGTITWPSLTFAGGPYTSFGMDYANCNRKFSISGTGTALDSNPGAYSLGSGNTFTAPSGATNLDIASGTINTFAWHQEDAAKDFMPNSIYNTLISQLRAANPHPTIGHPMASNQNGGNILPSPMYCGNSSFSDFCEVYIGIGRTNTPQLAQLVDLINLRPGGNAITGNPAYEFRAVIGNAGSQRAFLGQVGGILSDYYLAEPNSLSGTSCSGDTCTFPSDHGIRNVIGHCGTQLVISGSSNSDWNATFCVTAAPTSTTLRVAREGAHLVPGGGPRSITTITTGSGVPVDVVTSTANNLTVNSLVSFTGVTGMTSLNSGTYTVASIVSPTEFTLATNGNGATSSGGQVKTDEGSGGTMHWSDGSVLSLTNITLTTQGGGHVDNFNLPATDHCIHNGQDFTLTGVIGAGASYYNSTTFYSPSTMVPLPDPNCNTTSKVMEYLPSGDASGTISVQLYPDAEYHKGLYSAYQSSEGGSEETLTGPYQGAWIDMQAAVARGTGTRLYDNIGPYNSFSYYSAATLAVNSTAHELQPSIHPFYDNGDSSMMAGYWAHATPQLASQRFAQTGYLYGTPAANGCPGLGFWFDCDLRSSSKGNLLLIQSAFGAPISRTIDISGCTVAGQAPIRYVLHSVNGITVTQLAVGATSDTPTFPTGGTVIYLCANNGAAEYNPPTLNVNLGNAASIQIRYAHTPYALANSAAQTINSSTGSVTIPWDPAIGKLYYQILFLDSSGAVIATANDLSL